VALLHSRACGCVLYLRIRVESGKELHVSPQHLIRARRQQVWAPGELSPSNEPVGDTVPLGYENVEASPRWLAAQDIRPGDELEDASSNPMVVCEIARACRQGAFAPLTANGTLLVDGFLCSCYAPPPAWAIPHELCHSAMMPLRALDNLRSVVEDWSRDDDTKVPLLTAEAIWVLPQVGDPTIHPWASGLLRCVSFTKALAGHLQLQALRSKQLLSLSP
jgi:hypothetical protein